MPNRKGYTLIELLVGLVILGLVTGSIYKLLVTTQRVSRAQAERVDLQSNVRAAGLVVPNELREINAVVAGTVDQNDILAMSATSIHYRAMRGIGYVCQASVAGDEIRVLNDPTQVNTWSGLRAPDAGRDDGYVFRDINPDLNTDDVWQRVTITAVAASTCGALGAYRFTISPAVPAIGTVPTGTPVRLYEEMELSLYPSGGESWLGARSVSAGEVNPQPLLGPLDAATGFGLDYFDASGATTTVPANVKSIRVSVKGLSYDNVAMHGTSSQLGRMQQSDTTQVTLRNAFRP